MKPNPRLAHDVIVFDLGNTLIRFDHNISARKISGSSGADIEKIYQTFFDSEFTRAFERGEISPRQFHERVSAFLGIGMAYEEFVAVWNDIFWEDKEMCDLARHIKGNASHRLFLLSNLNNLHFRYIREKFDIIDIFDELILSFEVGAIKPEKKIYDEVLRRGATDASRVVYIDDREDLITEALKFGIDAIRFENNPAKLKKLLHSRGIL